MFKETKRENKQCSNNKKYRSKVNFNQKSNNNLLQIIVGSSNVKRWNILKRDFLCTSNEKFVTKLLDLAQKHLASKDVNKITGNKLKTIILNGNDVGNSLDNMVETKEKNVRKSFIQTKSSSKENESKNGTKQKILGHPISNDFNNFFSDVSDKNINSNKDESCQQTDGTITNGSQFEQNVLEKNCQKNDEINGKKIRKKSNVSIEIDTEKVQKNREHKRRIKKKIISSIDVRKVPELLQQNENVGVVITTSEAHLDNENKNIKKSKSCKNCNTNHLKNQCPIENPDSIIHDAISKEEWSLKNSDLDDEDDEKYNIVNKVLSEKILKKTYSNESLPKVFCLLDSNTSHGLSVFAQTEIENFSQFGPLVAQAVKEVDIQEEFPMRELWMIFGKDSCTYWRTDYLNKTNWFRYLRPAPVKEQRNAVVVSKNDSLVLLTVKNISSGEEILFWQDDNLNLNKKKMGRTSCGGCNMAFSHSLYYRTHCTIFHDIRYSLTIRKFHCKVCGVAVLGKENIMKHAIELHNGQGAYQCQFCKKFFLRLNYLDMHRTYGCSANPHRTWPLCDFCGKKFCQPQKLKIHIKRMHNDISEVLKEMQCKSCFKVLGSRAALQRHFKEVHNKQIQASCACYRCGKLFQNKSNLKIHMLTHSGIKPFRCKEDKCSAAFTTKQCLQFHYKKVHNFTEDVMPKIERSVDYTFEAYSGMENGDSEHKNFDNSENSFDCDNEDNEENDENNDIDEENADDHDSLEIKMPLNNDSVEPLIESTPPVPPLQTSQPEPLFTMKILSKGSKKWMGENIDSLTPSNLDNNTLKMTVDNDERFACSKSQNFEVTKSSVALTTFGRHESSNASLLVEAALGSVADINCNDSNIDIDVSGTPNSTDTLVNNICTLNHPDELPDVPYNSSVSVSEHRNMGLISPSENISVTDDLNTNLHNDENIGIDYSTFQEGDFSSNNSPEDNEEQSDFHCEYTNTNRITSHEDNNYDTDQSKNLSPVSSPPRYNFGNGITISHVSPDNPNCIGAAQNLSLHDSKEELDLSIYKSSYGLETNNFHLRKDLKMKVNVEPPDHKQLYVLEVDDISRNLENKYGLFSSESTQVEVHETRDGENKTVNESASDLDLSFRSKYPDSELETRSKQLEFDLNFRSKSYDQSVSDFLQIRSNYENLDLDFRNKNYSTLDNSIESELRTDRNFDTLVFNQTDLQGIDMTARSFHNYNRYHHLYPEVERTSIDLRVNYSPPPPHPPPTYSHSDVLRVVSLDLTSPGRHTVDLSLRSNPLHAHQLPNARLLAEHNLSSRLTLDQNRLLTADLTSTRHLESHSRLLNVAETNNRILSDHSTNRLLSNDQNDSSHFGNSEQNRLISEDTRYLNDQSRLIESGRLLSDVRILPTVPSGSLSPIPYPNYSVSPTPYHPTVLSSRAHVSSPTPPTPYHHYSSYY